MGALSNRTICKYCSAWILFVVLLSNIRQNCDCCHIRCHSCIMSATASRSEVSSSEVLLPLEDFKSLKIYRVHTGLLQGYLQDRVDSLISGNLMMMMFVVSTWRSPPRNNRARSNASFQALMQSSLSDSQNADTWSKSKPPGNFWRFYKFLAHQRVPNFGCKERNTFDASENPWQPLCGKLFPQIKVINLWLASFFEAELDSKSHPKVLNRKTCSYWCTPRPSSAARWQLRWSWSLQPPSRNQRIGSWLLSSTGLLLQEHALFVQLPSISPSYWRTLQDSTQRWKTLYKSCQRSKHRARLTEGRGRATG